jgi:hypothetical protein
MNLSLLGVLSSSGQPDRSAVGTFRQTDGAFRNIVYVPIHIIWFPFLDRLQKTFG